MSNFTYDKVEQYGADVVSHIKKKGGKVKATDGKTYTLKITAQSIFGIFSKKINNVNLTWKQVQDYLKKNKFEVLSSKRKFLSWTEIEKTSFSSTDKGKKPPAATKTALAESAACIATAYLLQQNKDLTLRDLSSKISIDYLTKEINDVVDIGPLDSKKGIKQILDWLKANPAWLDTSIRTAQILKKELKLQGGKSGHHFHRDSAFMHNIYTEAAKHIKKLNTIGLRIGGDKWNPGDIWIAMGSGNKGFSAKKDLVQLNEAVAKKFDEADIMGVSLKKLGKNATFQIYNLKEQERNFIFDSIKRPAGDLMDSKDIYIVTKSGKELQIRTFDTKNNIQAEIKGSSAAGGKAGFGVIAHHLYTIAKVKIPTWQDIGKLSRDAKIKLIQKHYKDIFGLSISPKKITEVVNGKKNDNGKLYGSWTALAQDDYWASKIQALHIASVIKDSPKRNDLLSIIVAYAASLGLKDMFDASVYAKIY